jgi:hypothetical protein
VNGELALGLSLALKLAVRVAIREAVNALLDRMKSDFGCPTVSPRPLVWLTGLDSGGVQEAENSIELLKTSEPLNTCEFQKSPETEFAPLATNLPLLESFPADCQYRSDPLISILSLTPAESLRKVEAPYKLDEEIFDVSANLRASVALKLEV